ncbi:MAG: YihY/virulence factor BrkB family protein [Sandaracinus sp.]|nr:YihY/virulence factor BrkB family protein [Sandaracinus sp.]
MLKVVRRAFWSFRIHEGSLLSGAVAFYALLAFAPLGVLAVVGVGWLLGADAARDALTKQVETYLDPGAAHFLMEAIERGTTFGNQGRFATFLSGGFLIIASTRLFWMLRGAINHAWGIRSTVPPGFFGLRQQVLRRRLVAFGMLFVFGAAFIVMALVKAGINVANVHFGRVSLLWRGLDLATSVALFTILIALIFRWLPDARIAWRDAVVGAFATAVLNTLGSVLIGHYLARISPTSMYGAAGSLVVLLLWVYYSTQIFLFGAELTAAWAHERGSGVHPLPYATVVAAGDRPSLVLEDFEVPPNPPDITL